MYGRIRTHSSDSLQHRGPAEAERKGNAPFDDVFRTAAAEHLYQDNPLPLEAERVGYGTHTPFCGAFVCRFLVSLAECRKCREKHAAEQPKCLLKDGAEDWRAVSHCTFLSRDEPS